MTKNRINRAGAKAEGSSARRKEPQIGTPSITEGWTKMEIVYQKYEAFFSALRQAAAPPPPDLCDGICTLPESNGLPGLRQVRALIDLAAKDPDSDGHDVWDENQEVEDLDGDEYEDWDERQENGHSAPGLQRLQGLEKRLDETMVDFGCGEDLSRETLVKWLADQLPAHVKDILSLHERRHNPAQRVWLAAHIGDWPTAHAGALVLGEPRLVALTRKRAERWVRDQPDEARGQLGFDGSWVSEGTARTLSEHSVGYFVRLLRRDFKNSVANVPDGLLTVLWGDLDGWEGEVYRVLEALSPRIFNWQISCAVYLARRDYRTRDVMDHLVRQMQQEQTRWDLRAVLLLLRFHFNAGKEVARRALRSPSEMERIEVLAVLSSLRPTGAASLLRRKSDKERFPVAAACHQLAMDRIRGAKTTRKSRKVPGQVVEVRDRPAPGALLGRLKCRYMGSVTDFFAEQIQNVKDLETEMKLDKA